MGGDALGGDPGQPVADAFPQVVVAPWGEWPAVAVAQQLVRGSGGTALRHTTLTWVERNFGYGIARAYAGHTDKTGPATTTYIKADLQAVATALAALTGQPHPLATSLEELGIRT